MSEIFDPPPALELNKLLRLECGSINTDIAVVENSLRKLNMLRYSSRPVLYNEALRQEVKGE